MQAEEIRGESLGHKGFPELESTQRRALLQFGMALMMGTGGGQGQKDNQAPPSPRLAIHLMREDKARHSRPLSSLYKP